MVEPNRFWIPTEEPITDELLLRIKNAPSEYFDMSLPMDGVNAPPDMPLAPLLAQSLLDTPLYKFLARIAQAGAGRFADRIDFENDNERELLRTLYQKTPGHVIVRLRNAIGWTLNSAAYSFEFWDILIENIQDARAYVSVLSTAEDLGSTPERRNMSLLMIMLFAYHPLGNERDMRHLGQDILEIGRRLMTLFDRFPLLLEGVLGRNRRRPRDTMLDTYIRSHPDGTRHQYFVAHIAAAMDKHNVPFIYWEDDDDDDDEKRTANRNGGVLHALLRRFVDHDDLPDGDQDTGTIAIHRDNFVYVWKRLSSRERLARDGRDRTAHVLAHVMAEKASEAHRPTGDLAFIINLTAKMTKSAAGTKARRIKRK